MKTTWSLLILLAHVWAPSSFAVQREELGPKASCSSHLLSIHPTVAQWLAYKQPLDQSVRFNFREYPELAFLGEGGEGAVMLVATKSGLATIKEYDNIESLLSGMAYKAIEFPYLPRLRSVDFWNLRVLTTYHEGIPLEDIFLYGESLGLNEAQLEEIYNKWAVLCLKIHKSIYPFKPKLLPQNAVYSFKDEKIYFIDGR